MSKDCRGPELARVELYSLGRSATKRAGQGRGNVGRDYDLLGRFLGRQLGAGGRRRTRGWINQAAVLDNLANLLAIERLELEQRLRDDFQLVAIAQEIFFARS